MAAPVAALAIVLLSGSVEAEPDLSGRWTIDQQGVVEQVCKATIGQYGNELAVSVECSLVGPGELTGLINPTSGNFTLLGYIDGAEVAMIGSAIGDGESMSREWMTHTGVSGTFSGDRRPVLIGDIDDDGAISSVDALLVLRVSAAVIGRLPLWSVADVDENGQVDTIDASLILQREAGLIAEVG